MQTEFKRHQRVRLLHSPLNEDVEYYSESKPPIVKGMTGKINVILPNGQYHVEIIDEKTGETIAYAAFDEESLEAIDDPQDVKPDSNQKEPEDWAEED